MKLRYRTDIDGLRAIAVLSVLFDHLGIRLFHGGYIGVDIFFVISGYLITGIIVQEIKGNEFSLVRFYERRIRRIFPALFVALLFTVIASAILYDTGAFRDFGRSVVATTFFFSNIHFWTETGYFDAPAQIKPLLHTWSLAVEEQYYIVFPLLMVFLVRYFKSKIPYILGGITLISFGWNLYALHYDASSAFYFSHLRAWELLIGGLLSLNLIVVKPTPFISNILVWIGFGMILIPMFLYSSVTEFPGVAAAIPVLGTALIIHVGKSNATFINGLLGTSPLVFIGKISYSLYLWHWPLIIFSKYYAIKKLTTLELSGIVFFTIVVAALSWKFIEIPLREKRVLKGRRIFIYAASIMIIAAITGSSISSLNPSNTSSTERVWSLACNFNQDNNKKMAKLKACPIGAKDQPATFVLWGDSHARVAAEGVSLAASKQNLGGSLMYSSGCPPLLGITRENEHDACELSREVIMKYIVEHPELKVVILAGRWTLWAEGSSYSYTDEIINFDIQDIQSKSEQKESSPVLFERGLERTVKALLELDRKVVIISQVPEIGYDVPLADFIARRTGRDTNKIIALPLEKFYERNNRELSILDKISNTYKVEIVDPWKILCNDTACLPIKDEQVLYEDDHHLSVIGSQYLAQIYDLPFHNLAEGR